MDGAKSLLGATQNDSSFPTLSWKQRIIGFLVCEAIGIIIQLVSLGSLIGLLTGSPTKFAITYTLGNIMAIIGTLFLKGPVAQFKAMVDKKRLIATIFYILAIVGTIVSAVVVKEAWLVIICIVVQFIALIIYCLSYIPFGNKAAASGFKLAFGGDVL